MGYDLAMMEECDGGFMYINNVRMIDALEALIAAGAVATEYSWDTAPDCPPLDEGKVHYSDTGEPLTDQALAVGIARDEFVRWVPGDVEGIPLHKLRSNDGWIVTPEECSEAAQAWVEAPPDVKENAPVYVRKMAEWIALAADHGGFCVW